MTSPNPVNKTRHVYRIQRDLKILYLFIALWAAFAAILSLVLAITESSSTYGLALTGTFAAISIYLVALALNSRLVIDATHIELCIAFGKRSAQVKEIQGFRRIESRSGLSFQLRLKENYGIITIPHSFSGDENLRAWFQHLADLDDRDRKWKMGEFAAEEEEPSETTEHHKEGLKLAREWNLALHLATLAAAILMNIGGAALELPAGFVLALAPLVALFLVHREPLHYAVFKPRNDPRNNTHMVLLIAALGFLVRNFGVHFVSLYSVLPMICLLSLLCIAVLFNSIRESPVFVRAMIGVVAFSILYSYGLVTAVNSMADTSKATAFTADVVGKQITTGRSIYYELKLSPWGPYQDDNVTGVSPGIYGKATVGSTVCLELHPGTFSAAWYRLINCS